MYQYRKDRILHYSQAALEKRLTYFGTLLPVPIAYPPLSRLYSIIFLSCLDLIRMAATNEIHVYAAQSSNLPASALICILYEYNGILIRVLRVVSYKINNIIH
jgi:hypothetical protein